MHVYFKRTFELQGDHKFYSRWFLPRVIWTFLRILSPCTTPSWRFSSSHRLTAQFTWCIWSSRRLTIQTMTPLGKWYSLHHSLSWIDGFVVQGLSSSLARRPSWLLCSTTNLVLWRSYGRSQSIWRQWPSCRSYSWCRKPAKLSPSPPIICLPWDHTEDSTFSTGFGDTTQRVRSRNPVGHHGRL